MNFCFTFHGTLAEQQLVSYHKRFHLVSFYLFELSCDKQCQANEGHRVVDWTGPWLFGTVFLQHKVYIAFMPPPPQMYICYSWQNPWVEIFIGLHQISSEGA